MAVTVPTGLLNCPDVNITHATLAAGFTDANMWLGVRTA